MGWIEIRIVFHSYGSLLPVYSTFVFFVKSSVGIFTHEKISVPPV